MNEVLNIQGDAAHIPLADASVDLVFTSPPYGPQRTYGINAQRGVVAWVDWMLPCVAEMVRVCRGLVLLNCAGWTKGRCYQPGPEMLLAEWWRRGGTCWRPCYWHRVGIPGSGGPEWLRSDVEHVLAFTAARPAPAPVRAVVSVEETAKGWRHLLECGHWATRRDRREAVKCGRCVRCLPWSDNTANGHPPKYGPGGEMSHRLTSGERVNQWGRPTGKGPGRHADGTPKTAGAMRDGCPLDQWAADPWQKRGRGTNLGGRTPDGEKKRGTNAGPFGHQQSSVGRRANGDRKPPYFNGNDAAGAVMCVTRGTGPTGEQLPNREVPFPVLANPGNLVTGIPVGGNKLGHPLAHENEAPFPVRLAEWFIRAWCPPGGIVADFFGGSGTTADAARRLGRRAITMDVRWSQCQLTRRRLAEPVRPANARKPRPPKAAPPEPTLWEVA